jgi:hypothetical protein
VGINPPQPDRVDEVQRFELTFQIPPAMGQFRKFRQFGRVGIDLLGRSGGQSGFRDRHRFSIVYKLNGILPTFNLDKTTKKPPEGGFQGNQPD